MGGDLSKLTSVQTNILLDDLRLGASLGVGGGLHLESRAAVVRATRLGEGVHALLESITLPSEEVVTVLSVSGTVVGTLVVSNWMKKKKKEEKEGRDLRIAEAVHKRLLAILVVLGVVELLGIPHDPAERQRISLSCKRKAGSQIILTRT